MVVDFPSADMKRSGTRPTWWPEDIVFQWTTVAKFGSAFASALAAATDNDTITHSGARWPARGSPHPRGHRRPPHRRRARESGDVVAAATALCSAPSADNVEHFHFLHARCCAARMRTAARTMGLPGFCTLRPSLGTARWLSRTPRISGPRILSFARGSPSFPLWSTPSSGIASGPRSRCGCGSRR